MVLSSLSKTCQWPRINKYWKCRRYVGLANPVKPVSILMLFTCKLAVTQYMYHLTKVRPQNCTESIKKTITPVEHAMYCTVLPWLSRLTGVVGLFLIETESNTSIIIIVLITVHTLIACRVSEVNTGTPKNFSVLNLIYLISGDQN